MRYVRLLLLASAALVTGACFQISTVLTVNTDGSGTIQQRMLFTQAALTQLRQFSAFGGGGGGSQNFDPLSEQQARDAAATLGPGVTYVSSTPINTAEGQGRDVKYSFRDINQLHIAQTPPAPGGISVNSSSLNTDAQVAFALTKQPDGTSLLKVVMPQTPLTPSAGNGAPGRGGNSLPSADQMALIKPMFAGARMSLAIEPAGQLIRTSSPYVDGRRVTLVDVNLDSLLANDTLLQRLQSSKSPEETKALLKDVPGVRLSLDPETTIEFR
jgi:hypothetical protein